MPSYNSIKYREISDGQYTVTIDLQNFQNKIDLYKFKIKLKELSNDCADDISGIYELDGNKLVYKSETLFPMEGCGNNPKVLIVFGNPAFHSVKHGMFFFSKANNHRHGMWGKLQKANLIRPVRFSDDNLFLARKKEAEERKKLISAGKNDITKALNGGSKLKLIPGLVKNIISEEENSDYDRGHFKSFGDFSLNFEFVYHVLSSDYTTYMDTQHNINMKIFDKFKEEGIEFAYPTQLVYMNKADSEVNDKTAVI